jgi:hypothetical protein
MLQTSHFFFRCRQFAQACFRFATDAGIVSVCMLNVDGLMEDALSRRKATCGYSSDLSRPFEIAQD